jgi:hypothetical protein
VATPATPSSAAADAETQAGPGTDLPCSNIGQMVVDAATSQVFVSCPSTNSVSVLSFSGTLVTTIGGIAGANGMVDEGGNVYVIAENTGTIDAIDTTTLDMTPTGASGLVDALDLVYAGGYLWTADNSHQIIYPPFYRIDPSTGTVTTYSNFLASFVSLFFADPGNPNEIIALTSGENYPSGQTITIAGGVPTASSTTTLEGDGNPLDVSPDGSTLFAQDDEDLVGLSSSTFQPTGLQYPALSLIDAVATSSGDGGVIAYDTTDLSVYRLGDPSDLIGTTEWAQYQTVETNGLAFSPDGLTLFVVTISPESSYSSGPLGPAELHAVATNNLPVPPPYLSTPDTGGAFGSIPVGDISNPGSVDVQNTGPGPDVITGATFSGADPYDFFVDPSQCNPTQDGVVTIAAGASCFLEVYFAPGALGQRSATMTLDDNEVGTTFSLALNGIGTEGYYQAGANGVVSTYGDAYSYGDMSKKTLAAPIVSMTLTPDGGGYWLLGADGGIFSFGDASFYGSTGGTHLNKPVVGMAPTPDGGGYWLVASDGGIFTFGDAAFYGSTGGTHLNKPIVGMAPTPDGGGYWLVASDGGVFAFGDAPFYGSDASTAGQNVVTLIAAEPPTIQASLDLPAVRSHMSYASPWGRSG